MRWNSSCSSSRAESLAMVRGRGLLRQAVYPCYWTPSRMGPRRDHVLMKLIRRKGIKRKKKRLNRRWMPLVNENIFRTRSPGNQSSWKSVNSLNWVPCRCCPRLRWISSCVPGRLVDSQKFRHGRGWCHGLEGRLIGDNSLFKGRGAGKS